jgi:hypothetical protein
MARSPLSDPLVAVVNAAALRLDVPVAGVIAVNATRGRQL